MNYFYYTQIETNFFSISKTKPNMIGPIIQWRWKKRESVGLVSYEIIVWFCNEIESKQKKRVQISLSEREKTDPYDHQQWRKLEQN